MRLLCFSCATFISKCSKTSSSSNWSSVIINFISIDLPNTSHWSCFPIFLTFFAIFNSWVVSFLFLFKADVALRFFRLLFVYHCYDVGNENHRYPEIWYVRVFLRCCRGYRTVCTRIRRLKIAFLLFIDGHRAFSFDRISRFIKIVFFVPVVWVTPRPAQTGLVSGLFFCNQVNHSANIHQTRCIWQVRLMQPVSSFECFLYSLSCSIFICIGDSCNVSCSSVSTPERSSSAISTKRKIVKYCVVSNSCHSLVIVVIKKFPPDLWLHVRQLWFLNY